MSSATKNLFLSMENLSNLGFTVESFLHDTYGIRLKEIISLSDFQELMQDVMQETEEDFPNLSHSEKNKKAIVSIRNILFDRLRMKSQQPSAQQAVPSDVKEDAMPVPTPIERVSTKTEDSDEVFFKKLQDLELRRRVAVSGAAPQQPMPPPPSPPILKPQVLEEQPRQVQHVVVAVPPPPRHCLTYVISSWDRNILENPGRSFMVWNNSLPPLYDPMSTRIAGLFLPASLASCSPYVSIAIQGAGGASTSCLVYPDCVATIRRGWIRWSPMDISLSYIKSVSMPWAVELRAADGTPMPLGVDHYRIVSIAVDVGINTATLRLASSVANQAVSLNESDFQVGDQIWIYTKNDKKKTDVLSVSKDAIEVRYSMPMRTPTMSNAMHDWMNAQVLNYNRQWSLVLEVGVSASS